MGALGGCRHRKRWRNGRLTCWNPLLVRGRTLLAVWLAGATASTAVTLGAARLINDQRLTDTSPEVADAAGRGPITGLATTAVMPSTTAAAPAPTDVPGGPLDALAPAVAPPRVTTAALLPDPGTTVVASPPVPAPPAPDAPTPSQPASSAPAARGTTAPPAATRPRPAPPPATTAKPRPKPTAPPPATTRPAGCQEQSRSTAAGTVVVRFCGRLVALVSAVPARDHKMVVTRQVGRITVVFRHTSGSRVQVVARSGRGWSVRTLDGGNAAIPTPPPHS